MRHLPLDFRDQYFGCEIELTGITRATAAHALANLFGTRAEHSGGGYDAYRVKDLDGKEWKIVRDGSIHPEGYRRSSTSGEYKVELNSPKLEYAEMEKLQEVIRSLRRAGGRVNSSCGMHVHVDASKHTPQSLKNVLSINNVGFWDSIPLWAVTLIGGLLITVLSFTMILTVYGRMFSLWMYAAIAPIPLSTFAGDPTSSVGKNFIRSYAGVCLQGVVIALSCIIFSAISSSPPAVDTGASVVTAVWTYVGELAFNLLVLVGAIKGCDRIVKEIMGL